MFADDTSLFIVVDNDVNTAALSLRADLDKIDTRASTWAVDFNPNKTYIIHFSRDLCNHRSIHFGFNGSLINESITHYHLGLVFQSDATWSFHINDIYEKACSSLNILRIF